ERIRGERFGQQTGGAKVVVGLLDIRPREVRSREGGGGRHGHAETRLHRLVEMEFVRGRSALPGNGPRLRLTVRLYVEAHAHGRGAPADRLHANGESLAGNGHAQGLGVALEG